MACDVKKMVQLGTEDGVESAAKMPTRKDCAKKEKIGEFLTATRHELK
jgi:hypothetical protein